MFIALESDVNKHLTQEVTQQRSRHVDLLWNITHHLNVLHAERWRHDVNRTIFDYQESVVRSIRRGYDGSDVGYLGWTIPSALMYCITVYTTIGTPFPTHLFLFLFSSSSCFSSFSSFPSPN